jgi:ribosomal 30S subunit maturation factor RimM
MYDFTSQYPTLPVNEALKYASSRDLFLPIGRIEPSHGLQGDFQLLTPYGHWLKKHLLNQEIWIHPSSRKNQSWFEVFNGSHFKHHPLTQKSQIVHMKEKNLQPLIRLADLVTKENVKLKSQFFLSLEFKNFPLSLKNQWDFFLPLLVGFTCQSMNENSMLEERSNAIEVIEISKHHTMQPYTIHLLHKGSNEILSIPFLHTFFPKVLFEERYLLYQPPIWVSEDL